jgi:vacuolar-type H+-ATPase subunit I/STV1
MTSTNATRTLNTGIAGLLILGVAGVMIGFPWIGLAMIVTGFVLVVANRSRLARSIRPATASQRTHRLRMAALSGAIFVASVVAYLVVISDDQVSSLGLLGTSLPGTAALVAAVGFLVTGLLTQRTEKLVRP